MSGFDTPILFLIFNRPDTTARVFESIKAMKPKKLFVSADGARAFKAGESDICAITRAIITDQIDWDCDLQVNFYTENLGCRKAVSGGITWFFNQVPAGIILEDDCLPDPDFFTFCAEMLELYAHDQRIMHITGNNFQNGKIRGNASYYFSRYSHIWGWATWARAWKNYEPNMAGLEEFFEDDFIHQITPKAGSKKYWQGKFFKVKNNLIDTWDYQWLYATWKHNGLTIIPNKNLVTNIGFEAGTHFNGSKLGNLYQKSYSLGKIVHPEIVLPHAEADAYTEKTIFRPGFRKLLNKFLPQ